MDKPACGTPRDVQNRDQHLHTAVNTAKSRAGDAGACDTTSSPPWRRAVILLLEQIKKLPVMASGPVSLLHEV